MSLNSGMHLYHGSYIEIKEIDLSKCTRGKDFGVGFYLTSDIKQAINFIKSSICKALTKGYISKNQNYGYVSIFEFKGNPSDYNYYDFPEANQEWLNFVALNRRATLEDSIKRRINPKAFLAEIISGKVANDKTNPVITAYLNGIYGSLDNNKSADIAISLLLPETLKDQYCFITQRAVKTLKFLGVNRYEF